MKKLLLSTVMSVLVMIVLTSLAFAAPVETPFKGTMTGSETRAPISGGFAVEGQGSGNATHLGEYTLTYNALVSTPSLASTVTATFVAANGDMVYATATGQGTPAGDTSTVVEQYTITGGTGRFEGATGSFTMNRTVVRATGETSGYFEGTLILDKGKK